MTLTRYIASKTILFQGPRGSEIYNTLKKKADAPVTKNDERNNSNIHLIVSDSDEGEIEKQAHLSDVDVVVMNARPPKDKTIHMEGQKVCEQVINGDDEQTFSCNECKILSVDMAEIKLDLQLLWIKVGSLKEIYRVYKTKTESSI